MYNVYLYTIFYYVEKPLRVVEKILIYHTYLKYVFYIINISNLHYIIVLKIKIIVYIIIKSAQTNYKTLFI